MEQNENKNDSLCTDENKRKKNSLKTIMRNNCCSDYKRRNEKIVKFVELMGNSQRIANAIARYAM